VCEIRHGQQRRAGERVAGGGWGGYPLSAFVTKRGVKMYLPTFHIYQRRGRKGGERTAFLYPYKSLQPLKDIDRLPHISQMPPLHNIKVLYVTQKQ